jgi:hypothetical protein
MNVILLIPLWLQMMHLFVALLLWIPLVLASANLLFARQHFSAPEPQRGTSEVNWDPGFKGPTHIRLVAHENF